VAGGGRRDAAGRRVATVLLLAACLTSGCRDTRPWNGVAAPDPGAAPPLKLSDQHGRPYDLSLDKGRVVLAFFGYTHCPDVCSLTLSQWRRVKSALGGDSSRVRFVFVTIDPARDTPAVLRAYLAQFDSTDIALSGTAAEIDAAKSAWGVTAMPDAMDMSMPAATRGPQTFSHSAQVFVVDRQGKLRLIFPPQMPVDGMVGDLKRLL
jgi:protein SCO1/2